MFLSRSLLPLCKTLSFLAVIPPLLFFFPKVPIDGRKTLKHLPHVGSCLLVAAFMLEVRSLHLVITLRFNRRNILIEVTLLSFPCYRSTLDMFKVGDNFDYYLCSDIIIIIIYVVIILYCNSPTKFLTIWNERLLVFFPF